jgi:hypothetical protein
VFVARAPRFGEHQPRDQRRRFLLHRWNGVGVTRPTGQAAEPAACYRPPRASTESPLGRRSTREPIAKRPNAAPSCNPAATTASRRSSAGKGGGVSPWAVTRAIVQPLRSELRSCAGARPERNPPPLICSPGWRRRSAVGAPLRGRGRYLRRTRVRRGYVGLRDGQEADGRQGRGHGALAACHRVMVVATDAVARPTVRGTRRYPHTRTPPLMRVRVCGWLRVSSAIAGAATEVLRAVAGGLQRVGTTAGSRRFSRRHRLMPTLRSRQNHC